MNSLQLSHHAICRMAQRGVRADDIQLIMAFGTEVHDGFLVRNKDVHEVERLLKQFLQRLRHVQGKRIVARDETLITVFHATERQARNLLKKTSEPRPSCLKDEVACH